VKRREKRGVLEGSEARARFEEKIGQKGMFVVGLRKNRIKSPLQDGCNGLF